MNLPVQVTFRNMEPSESVEQRVRGEAAKLDRYFDHITSCRVMIEQPNRHQRRGRHFHVRIELGVPGKELVVKREPTLRGTRGTSRKWRKRHEVQGRHRDAFVVIHDAFREARRQIQDYVRRLRGDVKLHDRVKPERAGKLGFAEE